MIYLLIIFIAMLSIAGVNAALGAELLPALGITAILTAAVIAIDGILALLIRRLPSGWFSYDRRFFSPGRRELRLYRALGVKHLFRIVPDLGCFTNFPKKTLSDPGNPTYTERYLLEAAYGIVIHIVNMLDGFLILLLMPTYAVSIALPVALVNLVLSLLPVLLLRLNFSRLVRLHRRNLRKNT